MSVRESQTSKVVIVLLITSGIITGVFAFRRMYAEAKTVAGLTTLEVYGQAPAFTLTREARETGDGAMFNSEALRDQVWITDFIFTRCAGPCPRMTQKMADLQRQLADARDVKLVTFTVDPEHDTATVLRDYAKAFDADPSRWVFLTGDRQKIYDVSINGFKMAVGVDPADPNQLLHTTRFVLIDRRGRIRGYYDETEPDQMAKLADDARILAAEPRG